ncbi:hypothetical protein DMB65_16225 [Flavobacterium cheongpyeongense]|uniref:Outer membrane protein beta-barrel domain-containing protein n=1 Tax=Flavobacterium cheongpyeongense TaxID=2212651 RepID=A0A2V4BMQ4_9FLAO|nr:hypothetical protein [Flavobacterium cheongpyeongense]PXY39812.1 hypothetical protein DMB65_16225 [Flavobacterium cheongpyeongense]
MKKLIFISCIFLTVLNSSAQEFRPFVGLGGFVHLYSFEKDLQSSPAISLSAGLEYKATGFLLPEIEVNYLNGKYKDNVDSSDLGNIINSSDRSFSVVNFSFCPKIVLGDYNDGNYIQILPKYIFSLIDVRENIVSNSMISTQTEKSLSTSQHAIGLGVGYVINFDTWYSNSLAINVCYNTIRVSEPFDQLNPGTEAIDNVGVYGIEFKYYFGVKRLK